MSPAKTDEPIEMPFGGQAHQSNRRLAPTDFGTAYGDTAIARTMDAASVVILHKISPRWRQNDMPPPVSAISATSGFEHRVPF